MAEQRIYKGEDARRYVLYIARHIPGLDGALDLQQDLDQHVGDATTLSAVANTRAFLARSGEFSWLADIHHERLPHTKDHLDGKFNYSSRREKGQETRPFCHDGISWDTASREYDTDWLAALKELGYDFNHEKGCRYLNAFDHAMTAFIARGWGLSASSTCDGTAWKPSGGIGTLWDASIALSLFEALSELADASQAQERDICERAISDILHLRETGRSRQVPKTAYGYFDQLLELGR